jgi:hypothetical protein
MDHEATMRRSYEYLNAHDVDGFGDLLAGDFIEYEGLPGFPPTKGIGDYSDDVAATRAALSFLPSRQVDAPKSQNLRPIVSAI